MIQWRKSSYSQEEINTECIEVSCNTKNTTFIRDSKNSQGPRLTLTQREFTSLVHSIKAVGDTT
ncbi:DUF397 domain-containing protein [Actinomadura viridis]|uniref:DUF397 domain-containing protein n=1 Tax=Actinomadura viridis TaxID=58110 RepID=UPI0036ACF1DA